MLSLEGDRLEQARAEAKERRGHMRSLQFDSIKQVAGWTATPPVAIPGWDGSKVEVFGPDSEINRHFTTGPVAGFLVDDVRAAADELVASGVEILLLTESDESGNAWVHFRAPDGNIYEFTQDPGVTRPS